MSGGKSNSSSNCRMVCKCQVVCKRKKKYYVVCKCKRFGCDKAKTKDSAAANGHNSVSNGSSSNKGYVSKSSKTEGSSNGSNGGSASKKSKYGNGSVKPKSSKNACVKKYGK